MASGSSGRAISGAKGFDFATDDILCSYEDYGNQDSPNGSLSDPGVGTNSSKDFQKSRLARPTMYSSPSYSQPDDSLNQDIFAIVDKSMKKHADGIMRFLEGISSRLSQLELYCYNLDKSIGEMRSDLTRDQGDADMKLKSLDKHIQEVHRSVQILRDKQELADTQKELAKLQLAQKETSSVNSQNGDDKSSAPASESKKPDNAPDASNNQLALALPHQVPQQPQQHQSAPAPPQNVPQQQTYYLQPTHVPNPSGPTQIPQMQYVAADPHGRVPPQTAQPQVNQTQNMPQYPQYQQQWSQQQVQVQPPSQQSSLPPQMRNQATPGYPPYPATNPPPQEAIPSSISMQMQYSGVPPPVSSRAETVPYGYGGPTRVQQQPPSQPQKGSFGPPPGEGYAAPGGPQSVPQGSGYMVYEADGSRAHHPPQQQPHFSQGGYPPNVPVQNPPSNLVARNSSHPQFVRNHPYGELIEKLVSMGFRGDHAASVIQRMEESGQQVDFNGVLDRLNGHPPSSQRGWSG